jgi:hypothetical protein
MDSVNVKIYHVRRNTSAIGRIFPVQVETIKTNVVQEVDDGSDESGTAGGAAGHLHTTTFTSFQPSTCSY